ncbi:MAG TPA: type IV pilus biogenesis/stability protein PilW [Halothiobacillaceae bacterium]|nr:type IV pilus biogenesis/stability protein PilW [Halothiobacillaceae bacterium]
MKQAAMISPRWVLLLVLALMLAGCASDGPLKRDSDRGGLAQRDRAAEVNTELAVGYMREGHLDVAVEKAERAIEINPRYSPARHVYALLLDQLGEVAKAGREFEAAIRYADKRDSDLANNYGAFLCRQGEYDKAQAMFSRALENPLYKTPEFALTNSGRCYERAGAFEQALSRYEQARQAERTHGPATLGMARVYYELGEYQKAFELMQQYSARNRHTPDSLATAIRIDRAVGNEQSLANHRLILRGRFPDSPEAEALERGDL